jgi:hypothetical protein
MRRWATIPLLLLFAVLLTPLTALGQGTTTASMRGQVVDAESGEPLAGANVVAVHQPSGTQYGSAVGPNGRYNLANLRVGGPYVVRVSFVGYQTKEEQDISLGLGETRRLNFELQEQTADLEEVQVVAEEGEVFSKQKRGLSTTVSEDEIQSAPTLDRTIADFARLTPQAIVGNDDDDGASISIANQNNRYNSVFIDGAVSNDVFGLSATGLDGGQTGGTPISTDAIQQFNIEISPFDVTQSYFAGGAINAITRSGTNQFKGSLAFEYRDQNFTQDLPDAPFPEFNNRRIVGRLGGPIIKDKLFFFVNADINRENSPQPFEGGFEDFEGTQIQSQQDLDDFLGFVESTLGDRYDPGQLFGQATTLDSDKFLGKIDWNINSNHQLSARYSYTESVNVDAFGGNPEEIAFSSRNEVFPNTTQIGALELNSTFGNQVANKLIVSYKSVEDDRDTNLDQPFPTIDIDDGDAEIQLGGEPFSTVNFLTQEVVTLTDDVDIFLGDHTLTVGTHNEFYDIANKFVPFNYGWYIFPDDQDENGTAIDEFKETVCASLENPGSACEGIDAEIRNSVFARGFSLRDDNNLADGTFNEVIGDETNAQGAFRALNTSLYIQDEWTATDRLTLTAGVRVDVPIYLDDPAYADPDLERIPDNPELNPRTTTIPTIENFYSMNGARPGDTPTPNLHWAPRAGFNFDVFGNQETQLRGGTGVFTSRQPFVWPGGMYLNNGTNTGTVDFEFGANEFRPNPANGLTVQEVQGRSPSELIPSGRLEMFEEDYLNPRRWRTSLGLDQQLPGGFVATLEGQYTKVLSDVLVTNVNLRPSNGTLDGPDNRPIWIPSEYESGAEDFTQAGDVRIDSRYSNIHRVGNTSRGYSYNVTARIQNTFETETSALTTDLSYSYGDKYTVNDGTSSQINSLWDGVEHVNGANNIGLSRSDFSSGHRVLARLTYQQQFLERFALTASLIYDGQSGRPFSYVIGNSANMVQERGEDNSLLYVPQSTSQLTFGRIDPDDGPDLTPETQAAALEQFISENDYLSTIRGGYAQRNADRTPWEGVVDLSLRLDVFQELFGRQQSLQITADVFNFSAMVGSFTESIGLGFGDEWGERYFGSSQVELTSFREFEDPDNGDYTPVYTVEVIDEAFDTNGDGVADRIRVEDQDEIFNEIRTGSNYSSQWQMKLGVRYSF